MKGRGPLVSQAKGETHWSLKQTCQLHVCVLQPLHYFTKGSPPLKKDMCEFSDSISTYTQLLPLKNKNINHIFIYLRVFCCLSSSSVYNSSMVDVKVDKPNDGSMACLTRCWVDEYHRTMVRIKKFDRRTTAAHLLGWLLEMRIKYSHQKITMTHTQTTCPNHIALCTGIKRVRPAGPQC